MDFDIDFGGVCCTPVIIKLHFQLYLTLELFMIVENATGVKIYNKGTLCPGKVSYTTGVKVTL